jgi:hypothetical protein
MNRNAKMLEETRDTITVPARFLIRIISGMYLLIINVNPYHISFNYFIVLHQLQSRNRDDSDPPRSAPNENDNSDN